MDSSSPDLPSAPTFQTDPNYQRSVEDLYNLGQALTSFNFQGNLAPLQQMTTTSPDTLKAMFAGLQPYINQQRQSTISQLAANNQLESSVTANALTQNDLNTTNLMLGATVPLISQNIQNIGRLFETGLNTTQNVATLGLQNQAQLNQFNLANYENILAEYMGEQEPKKGGWSGALQGAAGGAMAGSMLGPWGALAGGILGGAGGYFGTQETGGNILSSGAGLYGMNKLANSWSNMFTSPGMSASNSFPINPNLSNMNLNAIPKSSGITWAPLK